jgi:L-ascorbate metabolism protein UlaG (beta-lactamase superfamily)
VGGTFTLGPREAARLVRRLRPRFAIPMHYRSAKVTLPIRSVEDFLAEFDAGERLSAGEIEISPRIPSHQAFRGMPREATRVLVLEASL